MTAASSATAGDHGRLRDTSNYSFMSQTVVSEGNGEVDFIIPSCVKVRPVSETSCVPLGLKFSNINPFINDDGAVKQTSKVKTHIPLGCTTSPCTAIYVAHNIFGISCDTYYKPVCLCSSRKFCLEHTSLPLFLSPHLHGETISIPKQSKPRGDQPSSDS